MSKYRPYVDHSGNELIFTKGDFQVYATAKNIGRYVLVVNGVMLAFKNVGESEPDFSKWITAWTKNATKQLHSIGGRIDALRDEQDEILSALTGRTI